MTSRVLDDSKFVLRDWDSVPAPVWAGLTYEKMDPVSTRLSPRTIKEMRDVAARVPGLTDSGTVRFLSVLGLEVMRCVERYAPSVIDDAIHEGDAPLLNTQRLAGFACPLVASCFDEVLSGGDE
jgi:hypothetical protein